MAPRDMDYAKEGEAKMETAPAKPAPVKAEPLAGKAETAPPRSRKKRVVLMILLLAVLAGAGHYGREWWTTGRFEVATDDAYVAADYAVLAPKVSGYVAEVMATNYDVVKKGDPLIRLEDGDYQVRLRVAEAAVEGKKASLTRIESQIGQSGAMIDVAKANVDAARAMMTMADADLGRYEDLAKSDYASRQKLESARATQASARADLAARLAGVTESEAALQVAIASRAEMQAALAGAEAERDQAARDLEDTVIRAPFDGVVGNLNMAAGEFVQTGARLMALVPLQDIYIDANFKETQVHSLAIGSPVHVEVDAYPGRSFTGHVVNFAPATGSVFSLLPPENATGNFTKVVQRLPVRISVPAEVAAEGWLRPGLSVIVSGDSRDAGE